MGSGLCGVITVFRTLAPEVKIYGVQAEGAPSYFLSWQAKSVVPTKEAHTFADGVATRSPSAYTLEIILNGPAGKGVDEVLLVDDSEIIRAIRLLWRTTHNLVEGAGAAALAAAMKHREQFHGKTIVAVLSGGNLDTASISKIFV
jgi:threonine dehydratase